MKISVFQQFPIFMLIWIQSAFATSFYTTNSNEIKNASAQASPGDTIIMAEGLWFDEHIVFSGNGTGEAPILLLAETPGRVILSGTSTLRISGEHLVVSGLYFRNGYSSDGAVIEFRNTSATLAEHCRLTNSAIVDYNPPNRSTDYKWVSLYGTQNRVDSCYFKGKEHSGTTLVIWFERVNSPPAHYHRIDHNYFGYRPELGANGGETIRIGTSTYSMNDSYTTVESNLFEKCNGEMEIISNKSCENLYFNNTFLESQGTLTLRHGNMCQVYGNFFFGNGEYSTGGVRIIGEDHRVYNNYFQDLRGTGYRSAVSIMNGVPDSPLNRYFQVKRAEIIHNTIINCSRAFEIGSGAGTELSLPPVNSSIVNNLVYNTGSQRIVTIEDQPDNMFYSDNYFYGGELGISDTVSGILKVDPLLVDYGDSLWRPVSTSPVIGNALMGYGYMISDMDGHPRGMENDVGADQVSQDPINYKPVTRNDVGPAWLNTPGLPLFVSVSVNGSGHIELSPDKALYDQGDTLTILAVPASGWTFSGWSGDVNGMENPLIIPVNEDMTLTAHFSPPLTYAIYTWIIGSGSINLDPPGPEYDPGTLVEVSAIPAENWVFTSWSGDLAGTNNPDTVKVDSNLAIMATFDVTNGTDDNDLTVKPGEHRLLPVFPNPFNAVANIQYLLSGMSDVEIIIYNTAGKKVEQLTARKYAGSHVYRWHADEHSSGLYIVTVRVDDDLHTRKMLLIK